MATNMAHISLSEMDKQVPHSSSISDHIRTWVSILVTLGPICIFIFGYIRRTVAPAGDPGAVVDPAILKRYSQSKKYHVPATGYTYDSVRTVYRPHPQAAKFPQQHSPLPLLVFIHGLGGCAAQFAPLMTSLINVSSCLAIDLPGCGKSHFSPQAWPAYTTNSLVQLLAVIIESYRDVENGQGVVFIAHSMGCSLSAMLASPETPGIGAIPQHTLGLIAMCPRAGPLSPEQESATRKLTRIPSMMLDFMRRSDRRGGVESTSVHRIVGPDADLETKKLQLLFNLASRTPVWRRMTSGLLTDTDDAGERKDGLPGQSTWESLDIPVFLVAGESDKVAPPENVHEIAGYLQPRLTMSTSPLSSRPSSPEPQDLPHTLKPSRVLKVTVLHHPAAHAIPYAPSTTRTLSGLIQPFLSSNVDPRLSIGWQLTYLSDSGKWDVKNLVKWRQTPATSDGPIADTLLAIKTMREVDDVHCPKVFVKHWAGRVRSVVDISHESPVYDPKGLEAGGIAYHKFPTVSKLPPTDEEVDGFVKLVDKLREESPGKLVAVHCHYGFNRTGFFTVCYLVDRLGWKLQAAIDEFARLRPPGIKHDYFTDRLFVRYLLASERAGMEIGGVQ